MILETEFAITGYWFLFLFHFQDLMKCLSMAESKGILGNAASGFSQNAMQNAEGGNELTEVIQHNESQKVLKF